MFNIIKVWFLLNIVTRLQAIAFYIPCFSRRVEEIWNTSWNLSWETFSIITLWLTKYNKLFEALKKEHRWESFSLFELWVWGLLLIPLFRQTKCKRMIWEGHVCVIWKLLHHNSNIRKDITFQTFPSFSTIIYYLTWSNSILFMQTIFRKAYCIQFFHKKSIRDLFLYEEKVKRLTEKYNFRKTLVIISTIHSSKRRLSTNLNIIFLKRFKKCFLSSVLLLSCKKSLWSWGLQNLIFCIQSYI